MVIKKDGNRKKGGIYAGGRKRRSIRSEQERGGEREVFFGDRR